MRALVTGAAGFIGSTLCESLLSHGHEVRGIDCLTPYYSPAAKRANLEGLTRNRSFQFMEVDLRTFDLLPAVKDIDVVFHLAAQPGIRSSWKVGFGLYAEHNILATQRLLESCVGKDIKRLVYASSSSIYGNSATCPSSEDDVPGPYSPYGVTKLAGEHLCRLYAENYGLSTISLRYFTVYGPRQRPDMAIRRIIESVLSKKQFELFGTGDQIRDFTFVDDVVRATRLAGEVELDDDAAVINVAGGSLVTMNELLEIIGTSMNHEIRMLRRPRQAGDVDRTAGCIDRATSILGWNPEVDLSAGVAAQIEWHLRRRGTH